MEWAGGSKLMPGFRTVIEALKDFLFITKSVASIEHIIQYISAIVMTGQF